MSDFALEAGELTRALKRVSGCVQKIATIPALTYVRISATAGKISVGGTTIAMEAAAEIRADVAVDGKLALHCETLIDMIKDFPKAALIAIKRDEDGRALITCGRSRSRFSILDHDDLPSIPLVDPVVFSVKAADLVSLFEATAFAASRSESKPYMMGVCLGVKNGILSAIGTDDVRVSYAKIEAPPGSEKMPRVTIPSSAVQQMMSLLSGATGDVSLSVTPSAIGLEVESIKFKAQLLGGEYPHLDTVLARPVNVLFRAQAKAVGEAAKRMSAVFNQHRESKIVVPCVGFVPVGGEVQLITGGVRGVDEATEMIDAPVAKAWPEFGLKTDYLGQGLSLFSDVSVEFCLNESGSTILLRSPERPNVLHFIATMRR
jgi:DNA polymerase-3 subunit beta